MSEALHVSSLINKHLVRWVLLFLFADGVTKAQRHKIIPPGHTDFFFFNSGLFHSQTCSFYMIPHHACVCFSGWHQLVEMCPGHRGAADHQRCSLKMENSCAFVSLPQWSLRPCTFYLGPPNKGSSYLDAAWSSVICISASVSALVFF